MTEPATEIAYLPLVPGTDLTTGETKEIWDKCTSTIRSQKGCRNVFWGKQVEHPDIAQFVIEWDSLQSHKNFMAAPYYPAFLDALKPILADTPQIFHIKLTAGHPLTTPISAPVTECLSLYLDPSQDTAAYDANFAKFVEEGESLAKEVIGVTGGWGIEEQEHENLGTKEGEKGPAKFFGAFGGWPSIEAHMEFRKHEKFPEVIQHLRDGAKGVSVHHVHFTKV